MVLGSRLERFMPGLLVSLLRIKEPKFNPDDTADSSGNGCPRMKNVLDLVNVGLGMSLGVLLYVAVGQGTKDVTGPAMVISVLIAAFTSSMSGICFAELRCRWPRINGQAYEYTYFGGGEVVAFMVGWTTLLQNLACTCAAGRAISQNMDAVLGFKIFNITATRIGEIPSLQSRPDFIAAFIIIIFTATSAVKVTPPNRFPLVVNIVTITLSIFFLVVGLFHIDFTIWSGHTHFFPNGMSGVLQGAAVVFYGFTAFEVICNKSDFVGHSGKRPLFALCGTVFILLFFAASVSTTISLLVPISGLKTEAPLPEAFNIVGVEWIRFFVGIGAIIALTLTLWGMCLETSSIICRMAEDGLLFDSILWTSIDDDTPLIPALITGVISVIFSIIFNLTTLISLASWASLLIYTITTLVIMNMRYKPPLAIARASHHRQLQRNKQRSQGNGAAAGGYGATTNQNTLLSADSPVVPNGNDRLTAEESSTLDLGSDSDTDIDDIVQEYKERLRVRALTTCGIPSSDSMEIPTPSTHRRALVSVLCFTLFMVCVSITLHAGTDKLKGGSVILILLLILFLVLSFLSAGVLIGQPFDVFDLDDVAITIPVLPWIPLIALVLHVHLIVSLTSAIWPHLLIWMLLGCLVYILYGFHHSHASMQPDQLPEEQRGLLPNHTTTNDQAHLLEDQEDSDEEIDLGLSTPLGSDVSYHSMTHNPEDDILIE